MAEIKDYTAKADDNGKIIISEEVIASIAAISASEIDGVAGLSASNNVADFLSKKPSSKGVKISLSENSAEINVTIIVKKGVVIPTVAKAVQDNVTSAVESMTGLKVAAVNVKVSGVAFEKEKKKAQTEEVK